MSGMVKPLTYGRMGNFLFQAATAIGYALRHDLPFTLPDTTKNPKWNPIYLQHLVNPKWDPSLPEVELTETTHAFQDLPFRNSWRQCNIVLDGYWQSEKYFKDFRLDILRIFGFKWAPVTGLVSVHVRRGDYLKLTQKHPPIGVSWYHAAMAKFPGCHFMFFSDDIQWCRDNFGHRKDVVFSDGINEEDDLMAMSWCEHHICSASTFSWWGAWLDWNPSKRVIMPALWFVPGHGNLDIKDIVPAEWERQ